MIEPVLASISASLRAELPKKIWVAFSGGMDSAVLLHAAASFAKKYDIKLEAIHINHKLQAPSDQWAKHCQSFAQALQVNCMVQVLHSKPAKGQSIEEWARTSRYDCFKSHIAENEVMLLAHHLDDQAETVLLQLLRGAGPRGLSAMPRSAVFGQGQIVRPFLDLSREQIEHYAHSFGIEFIEDPSNQDTQFDRNFIRHEIISVLKRRWPKAAYSMATSARNCQEQEKALSLCLAEKLKFLQTSSDRLSIEKLSALSPIEQNAALRLWLKQEADLDIGRDGLAQIYQVIQAKADAEPLYTMHNWEIRRFQAHLYLMKQLPDVPDHFEVKWDGSQALIVPTYPIPLSKALLAKQGLDIDQINWDQVSVRLRRGGEYCQPIGRAHSQLLKKCLQEFNIPPWLRDRLPLIYEAEKLIMVVGAFVCIKE